MLLLFTDFLSGFLGAELTSYLLLVIGFVLLTVAADWLVDGASSLAKRFHMSDLVIGLTVVAMGTSMPELVVNLASAIDHETDLAITNVLGSNIANILLILGCTAAIRPVFCSKGTTPEVIVSIIASVLVMIFALKSDINRFEGLILIFCFITYIYLTLTGTKKLRAKQMAEGTLVETEENEISQMPLFKTLFLIIVGLIGLACGGQATVEGAIAIATRHHIPASVIGVTIVAIGTSLPELATSIIAALKGHTELAIGNVVGSNVFNIFFVLGITSSIFPLPAYDNLLRDALIGTIASILMLLFIVNSKNRSVTRWEGIFLVVAYISYMIILVNEVTHFIN